MSPQPANRNGLAFRISLLILVFGVELVLFSIRFDTIVLLRAQGFAGTVGGVLPIALRGTVLFAFLGLVFGAASKPFRLQSGGEVRNARLSWHWWLVHLVGIAALMIAGRGLFATATADRDLWAFAALAAGVTSVASAALAVMSWRSWLNLIRPLRDALLYAAFVAIGALLAEKLWTLWWRPLTRATFEVARLCLLALHLEIVSQTAPDFILGTTRFSVEIARMCSGIEGISLMLTFGTAWLWFFRAEYRFPQALTLLPVGLAAIWSTNVIRITALILLGHVGYGGIAIAGFHSQAGWLAFIGTALGLVLGFQHVSWVRVREGSAVVQAGSRAPSYTAAYLAPMLAILAAGLIARAFSNGFEWLYPLRVVAAVAVLWRYRRFYRDLDWRPGWGAAGAGILVFLAWIGLEQATGHTAAAPAPSPLWTVFRILGATVTVPIAEELAFRGYLLRRLQKVEFECVPWNQWTFPSAGISSIFFGLMHGDRWLSGVLAGLAYAWVMRRSGRLGGAVAAHSMTNALLAVRVMMTGDWTLW